MKYNILYFKQNVYLNFMHKPMPHAQKNAPAAQGDGGENAEDRC